jgi:hypothetical protein
MSYSNDTYSSDTLLDLSVSPKLRDDLKTAASWARIIAIVNFINAGLNLVASVMQGNFFGALIGTAIAVFVNIYMFNFGRKVKSALSATNQDEFNDGLNDLRMYFKVYGIIIIVVLSLCLLGLLIFGSAILTKWA